MNGNEKLSLCRSIFTGKSKTLSLRACAIYLILQFAFSASPILAQQISFRVPDSHHDVRLQADSVTKWREGQATVIHLRGSVDIQQHSMRATADESVIWIQAAGDRDNQPNKLIVYLEGQQVTVRNTRRGDPHQRTGFSEDAIVGEKWLGRLYTNQSVDVQPLPQKQTGPLPEIFERARKIRHEEANAKLQTVAFRPQENVQTLVNPLTGLTSRVTQEQAPTVPDLSVPDIPDDLIPDIPANPPIFQQPNINPGNVRPAASGGAQVNIVERDPTQPFDLKSFANPQNPNERTLVASGGARVIISSPDINQVDAFKSDAEKEVIILADNVVGWQSTLPDGTERWELYLEGNVIFAKDRRIIYADQMYYDANFQTGTILNADIYTPIQNFEGLVRLKAEVVQQTDANNLTAFGAAFTSSRLAFPRYWLQSESIEINREQSLVTDPETGAQQTNPATGLPVTQEEYFATSNQNRVFVGGLPVFAWPRFRTSLNDPSLYLKRARIGSDSVFGTQISTAWDLKQLLGLQDRLEGTELLGIVDYLSERGFGFGTESTYQRDSFLGLQGRARGIYRSWFINDSGLDNLGRGRNALTPEEEFRGRIFARHFQKLDSGLNVRAELGYLSDRNFLESFFEREWDTQKDATTGIWLERNRGNQSSNLIANVQVNDFFAQTAWLPRFDNFTIGQSLFGRLPLVRYGHSQIGYGRLRQADAPLDPAEQFDPLAWEADVDGIRAGTRQKFELPRQLGAVKVVPYALGDVTYWQEDLNGDDALRAFGQLGVRASLPISKVDPSIQSTLWNVNGLAHKVNFDVDAFYADSSQDLDRFALFDQLDDDSQEAFRRRFAFNTFGILPGQDVPLEFDERFFALRSNFQGDVTSPNEIADDLSIIRFGVRQRWQTKRGLPGEERVIDWISFDVSAALFPEASRDNFGADFGMLKYDFRWFLGDRLSLVSDGYADFFSQGLRTVSVGLQANRPGVADTFIGFRSIEGPISSNVLSTAVTYRMSEKWGLRANSQIDFGEAGTIGNGLSFLHLGESFILQFGVNADFSRDNVGFRFGFEPRFIGRPRLFRPGGQALPPASSQWLE